MDKAQRRATHEALCRIAQEASIPIKRVDVPWMIDVLDELQGISIEQALVLGAFLVGSGRGAMETVAVGN